MGGRAPCLLGWRSKLGTEYSTLDFKETWDLGGKDEVSFAKHAGAMMVIGSYIVVGVD